MRQKLLALGGRAGESFGSSAAINDDDTEGNRNGVTNNASNAFFFYSTGSASWTWNRLFGLPFKNGSNVSCTITHN